jgi:hypothetical protein
MERDDKCWTTNSLDNKLDAVYLLSNQPSCKYSTSASSTDIKFYSFLSATIIALPVFDVGPKMTTVYLKCSIQVQFSEEWWTDNGKLRWLKTNVLGGKKDGKVQNLVVGWKKRPLCTCWGNKLHKFAGWKWRRSNWKIGAWDYRYNVNGQSDGNDECKPFHLSKYILCFENGTASAFVFVRWTYKHKCFRLNSTTENIQPRVLLNVASIDMLPVSIYIVNRSCLSYLHPYFVSCTNHFFSEHRKLSVWALRKVLFYRSGAAKLNDPNRF